MGVFDMIGDFISYVFCIDTTEKPKAYKAKTEQEPEGRKAEKCNLSWYDNKKEYQLDYGCVSTTEYINGFTNAQRQENRHIWRLCEPCTPYPKTYRFYPSLDGL